MSKPKWWDTERRKCPWCKEIRSRFLCIGKSIPDVTGLPIYDPCEFEECPFVFWAHLGDVMKVLEAIKGKDELD